MRHLKIDMDIAKIGTGDIAISYKFDMRHGAAPVKGPQDPVISGDSMSRIITSTIGKKRPLVQKIGLHGQID